MAKRKLESESVANINEQRDSATVHCVLTELSPVKRSKKDENKTYFTAKLTDGKNQSELFRLIANFIQKWKNISKMKHHWLLLIAV